MTELALISEVEGLKKWLQNITSIFWRHLCDPHTIISILSDGQFCGYIHPEEDTDLNNGEKGVENVYGDDYIFV